MKIEKIIRCVVLFVNRQLIHIFISACLAYLGIMAMAIIMWAFGVPVQETSRETVLMLFRGMIILFYTLIVGMKIVYYITERYH